MKNIEEFSEKKFGRKDQQAENDKTERVTGLGRRTREEIAKWNQMTALRFQTGGGRHQTSPASLRESVKLERVTIRQNFKQHPRKCQLTVFSEAGHNNYQL